MKENFIKKFSTNELNKDLNSNGNVNAIDLSFFFEKKLNQIKKNSSILILLNLPLKKEIFMQLKNYSNYLICADGAANRLHEITNFQK